MVIYFLSSDSTLAHETRLACLTGLGFKISADEVVEHRSGFVFVFALALQDPVHGSVVAKAVCRKRGNNFVRVLAVLVLVLRNV